MRCKRCGSNDEEKQLMAATLNGDSRYLSQKCGDEWIMADYYY